MEEELIQESWWKRNWKWALPTGGCLGIVLIFIGLMIFGFYKVSNKLSEETSLFTFIKTVQTVQKSPEVIEALGKPIDMEEDIHYDPEKQSSHMALQMKLTGSKDSGTLIVVANKTNDEWTYETFAVTVDGTGEIIDLKKPED